MWALNRLSLAFTLQCIHNRNMHCEAAMYDCLQNTSDSALRRILCKLSSLYTPYRIMWIMFIINITLLSQWLWFILSWLCYCLYAYYFMCRLYSCTDCLFSFWPNVLCICLYFCNGVRMSHWIKGYLTWLDLHVMRTESGQWSLQHYCIHLAFSATCYLVGPTSFVLTRNCSLNTRHIHWLAHRKQNNSFDSLRAHAVYAIMNYVYAYALSCKYDTISKIRLGQWMRIYSKNNRAKCLTDSVWSDRASGF